MSASADANSDICLSTLRETDRDRYLACLLSPEDKRGALAALYAFNAEIAKIRDVIRQPLAGEIRLQWWRGQFEEGPNEEADANPVAAALFAAVETYRLPRQTFVDMLDARIFDLYDDAFPDRNALEGYAGETASALIQLAGLILSPADAARSATAAGHAGVAHAISGALLLMPIHSTRGQLYIPLDLLSAVGLDRETFLAGDDKVRISAAIEAFAGLGLDHLGKARAAGKIPASLMPAFLPATAADAILKKARKLGASVLEQSLLPLQWRRQLRMVSALLRRSI
ncbi:phytoene/squalene synthase family protein [Rhizobiales bacterium RZME27]|uniref:Phytoene/squalene synthase family protein n=1 Tax=Endobacterium cereale TaxID=2663029 RepID=A0A6A8AE52_9HYPH|nr:phytoene/squalene synthase family protein [Endobacterium cereale]MEB2843751.1 phytoene/squalene synthase family protein [Endobacterium cereale]MQY49402.1 phytoene/squalene synthase family protein [Endobacterium cereale]